MTISTILKINRHILFQLYKVLQKLFVAIYLYFYFHIILELFEQYIILHLLQESKSLIKDNISTTLTPITTPSYAVEFQKAVEEASRGRKIHNVQV